LSESGLFVVAAPSGGGKTSLINSLLDKDRQIKLSVSHTTRPARPGEVDGVHYHFVDDETFLDLMERDAFLEHAQVFDYRYGTGREAVEQQLAAGFDVILDIDWQGARQIRSTFPTCRTIFIIPPSVESLRQRLVRRGQDSEAVIRRRMRDAQAEISHWDEFDAIIVNDDFERALSELHALVRSEKQPSQPNSSQSMEVLVELLGTR
jgi:guanylate kinase